MKNLIKSKVKDPKKLLLVSITYLIAISLGAISWQAQFVVVLLAYFFAQTYILQQKIKLHTLILLSPWLLTYFWMAFSWGAQQVIPIALAPLMGVVTAKILNKHSLQVRIVSLVAISLIGWVGMANWLNYSIHSIYNRPAFATELPLYEQTGKKITDQQIQGKVTVLSFWTSNCTYCKKTFPDFDALTKKYANDSRINFYSVQIESSDDELNSPTRKYIQQFDFPILKYKEGQTKLKTSVGHNLVPFWVVLNQKREVIYTGIVDYRDYVYFGNVNLIVNQALASYKKTNLSPIPST